MQYRSKHEPDELKNQKCPECGSSNFIYKGTKIFCYNCDELIGERFNSFGSKKKDKSKVKDSLFEGSIEDYLDLRLRAGDIAGYDKQFTLRVDIHAPNGERVATKSHKVDFCVHELDNSFTLLEAKGVHTVDYQWRRDVVVAIWRELHPEYEYEVIQQRSGRYGKAIKE